MKKQILILTLFLTLLTGIVSAQDYEEEISEQEMEQILQHYSEEEIREIRENLTEEDIERLSEEQRSLQETGPFPEETINLTEQTEEIPGVVKKLIPGQRINLNLENLPEEAPETFPTEISIKLDSSLNQIEIKHEPVENPTLEVWVDVTIMEELEKGEHDDEIEALGEFIEDERIEFQAYGILNRMMMFPVEHIGFRFFL